jgi:hypothetical protein
MGNRKYIVSSAIVENAQGDDSNNARLFGAEAIQTGSQTALSCVLSAVRDC